MCKDMVAMAVLFASGLLIVSLYSSIKLEMSFVYFIYPVTAAAVLLELLFADIGLFWRVTRVNFYGLRSGLCMRGVWRLRRREQAVAGKHSCCDSWL